ncbi:predicted protein [Postia placenta Mad-698-R]|nr:predicted protein [Postia placenta Mad-698-R]EED82111.1 predicted protein [Postia placenta Mad-698-R]
MFAVRLATGATFALLCTCIAEVLSLTASTDDHPMDFNNNRDGVHHRAYHHGPYETTTITETGWNYPLTTTTEVMTYTYSGPIWSGSPTYSTVTVDYTSTYTEVEIYSKWYGTWPSACKYP